MYLIPQPQKLDFHPKQSCTISYDQKIVIHPSCGSDGDIPARLLQKELQDMLGCRLAVTKGSSARTAVLFSMAGSQDGASVPAQDSCRNLSVPPQDSCCNLSVPAQDSCCNLSVPPQNAAGCASGAYRLSVAQDGIRICAGTRAGLLYGAQTLRQVIRQTGGIVPCMDIFDYPAMAHRGYYLDVTRGRIPTPDYLKKLADRLAFYKINELQLYIEHSFLFEGLSEAWRDDTPLTAEDILELDAYCLSLGIELIPSLSCFGHLYKILRTKTCEHLCELEHPRDEPFGFVSRMAHHTIDASNPESLEFIKGLIQQYLPLFSSNHFNIGCDETFDLGKGRSRSRALETGTGRLYLDYVKELCVFLTSQGKIPMLWSDILSHFPQAIQELPEQTICLTWGYGASQDDAVLKQLAQAGARQYACPGVSGWNQMANQLENAYENIRRMCSYAVTHHAIGVLTTDWGDFGHINHPQFSLPGMIYGAAFSWNSQIPSFEDIGRQISRIEYADATETLVQTAARIPLGWESQWGNLIRYKEQVTEGFPEKNPHDIRRQLEALNPLRKQLYSLQPGLPKETRPLIHAYLTALKGIELFALLEIHLCERRAGPAAENAASDNFQLAAKDTASGNFQLAAELEEWFYEYKKLWRSVSRESELHQIQDVIFWYADLLREGNDSAVF